MDWMLEWVIFGPVAGISVAFIVLGLVLAVISGLFDKLFSSKGRKR